MQFLTFFYLLFTFQIGCVLGGFHGYPFQLFYNYYSMLHELTYKWTPLQGLLSNFVIIMGMSDGVKVSVEPQA